MLNETVSKIMNSQISQELGKRQISQGKRLLLINLAKLKLKRSCRKEEIRSDQARLSLALCRCEGKKFTKT